MNKQKIEQATASLAITFLSVSTIAVILLIADQIFSWDLFPPSLEKALGFILVSMGLIIFSSVIVNIMLNISLIATTLQEMLYDRHAKKSK
jgi:hypothetical protein